MPNIDYFLTTDFELSKEDISNGLPREITPKLDLGKDNRQWNKKQLNALRLLLCNLVKHHKEDNGIFFYERKKYQIKKQFNPTDVKYSSLHWVIDRLDEANLIDDTPAPPRTKNNNPRLTSEFKPRQKAIDFAISLGITHLTVKNISTFHVRKRNYQDRRLLEFEFSDYSQHVEMLMAKYSYYLNQQSIMLKKYSKKTGEDVIKQYGALGGEPIHLYRNYKNWSENPDVAEQYSSLFIETKDPDFSFGGRSGGYWHSVSPDDRETILINGNETDKADYPCSHINLCYKQETGKWYQTETYAELKEESREYEDAYITFKDLKRDCAKQMVQFMFNVRTKSAVSRKFSDWILRRNPKEEENASQSLSNHWIKTGYKPKDLYEYLFRKHYPIKDYFFKGKLAGQIIQWEEANLVHQIALEFLEAHDIPILLVYDEMIAEKEHIPMIKEFMWTSGYSEMNKQHSLMNQIKHL